MKIISFAETTPALLAGHKTVTRRDWKNSYARRFHAHELVQAWTKSPRAGGKKVGIIRLTEEPYLESTRQAPGSDWEAEGFAYLSKIGATVFGLTPLELWTRWTTKGKGEMLWVVRLVLVEILCTACGQKADKLNCAGLCEGCAEYWEADSA